jgi:hypothetical protein
MYQRRLVTVVLTFDRAASIRVPAWAVRRLAWTAPTLKRICWRPTCR